MDRDRTTNPGADHSTDEQSDDAGARADELVSDELLIEEISIDGMCGVY